MVVAENSLRTRCCNARARHAAAASSSNAAPMASTPTDLGSSGPISVTAHVTVSYEIR